MFHGLQARHKATRCSRCRRTVYTTNIKLTPTRKNDWGLLTCSRCKKTDMSSLHDDPKEETQA